MGQDCADPSKGAFKTAGAGRQGQQKPLECLVDSSQTASLNGGPSSQLCLWTGEASLGQPD